jgi:hypothetical protein
MRLSQQSLLLSFAFQQGKKKGTPKRKHLPYRKDFWKILLIEEGHRQYRKIPQCALIPLKLSPCQKLLASQNNQAFITMIWFNANFFDRLLLKFGPMFSGHTPFNESGIIVEFKYTTGRKREVQPEDCLGLVLVWMQNRGLLNGLQLVFGLTYSYLSVYLRFGVWLFVKMFRDDLLA